jgi:myo-inositol 2-dehydrogenase/D-chiro-inositol 1-dehydrogenase
MPGANLVVVAEADGDARNRARRLAPGAALFADYREAIARGGLDAVVVCLPPSLHAPAACAGLERGLHLYLEKPLATTFEAGADLVALWRQAGVIAQIGFNFRFHPQVCALRDSIGAGRLGRIVAMRTVFASRARGLPEWKHHRESGGGVLLDLASHHFDLIRFLLDTDIVEVTAAVRSIESEADTAVVVARTASGPLVTMLFSLAAVDEDRIELFGTSGRAVFDRYRDPRVRLAPPARDFGLAARCGAAIRTVRDFPRAIRESGWPGRDPSFALALASFVNATAHGLAARPDLGDGLASLSAVLAAERSASSGMTVTLSPAVSR